jgi:3-hydroxybutyrate dehydrogenase
VALVTGGAGGIGLAVCRRLSRAGAAVAVADVDGSAAREAAGRIAAEGGRAFAVKMDVADEGSVERGFDEAAAALGIVDVLVSNAGVQHIDALVDLSLADWRRVLAVHLDGAFLTTRAAMRRLLAAGRPGAVLYMGSVHSHEASVLKAPYVSAKHALLGLCRAVAKEGAAHGIRANVLCPGFVRTELAERQIPLQAAELGISEEKVVREVMLGQTVDGEFTSLEEVARAALFLVAFPTDALTGQSLLASHGWAMR